MSCSYKQKHLENDQEMDRISNLPDALLCHILSFVPTKSAVATSILSRRWISLWTKIPVLDFLEFPMSVHISKIEKKKFNSFIKMVMLHNNTPCLQRLYFEAVQGLDINHVNPMVNSVLKREIWEIHFNRQWARIKVPMLLPTSLFARERLMVLKISGPFDINVPLSLHLPRLKTLYFHEVNFVGQDVLNIVTSGCSALKELVIEFCTGLRMLHIDSLTLSRLRTTNTRKMMIAVKGPNIRLLDLKYATVQYDISDLSSLIEARIHVYAGQSSDLPRALELIRRISHVKILRLAQSAVELYGRFSENELPMFPNLTRLEIQIAYSMFQMLKHAPNLMHLIVDVGIVLSMEDDDPRQFPSEIVPQCLLSLPTIEIRRFGCYENDTELVRYILKNATVLKELKIHMHRASMKRERDAYKKLLSFSRFSTCQVIICSDCGEYSTY